MSKQSSVEWLISQLKISTYWKYLIMEVELMECGEIDIIEQAKARHKEEIMDANFFGQHLHAKSITNTMMEENAEQYYNENFGGNK